MILLDTPEKYLKATHLIETQKHLKESLSLKSRYYLGICNEALNEYNPDFPCQNYYLICLDEVQDWSYFTKDGKFVEKFCFECPICGAISLIKESGFDDSEKEYLHNKSNAFEENHIF